MVMNSRYKEIVDHYERCLEQHGDTHLGVDWPKKEDVDTRYGIMLDVIRPSRKNDAVTLLDLGCGTAHLYDFISRLGITDIRYAGLDISQKFVDVARKKYPDLPFFCGDVLDPDFKLPDFDYVVMNGVFTEKRSLSDDEMWAYFTRMLQAVFDKVGQGIAFNVMSKNVDWERDDLFHVSLDRLTSFLCRHLSRHFIIRNDYGLYEYSVYVYKETAWPK